MPVFFSSEVIMTVSDSWMLGRSSLFAVTMLSAIRPWRISLSSLHCWGSVPKMKIVCAILTSPIKNSVA